MSDPLVTSGVIAVAVLGFAPQNNAMLAAGANRAFGPILDGILIGLCSWLLLFAAALGALHLLPAWCATAAIIGAALVLATAGLARYAADPGHPRQPADPASPSLLPWRHIKSPESWAVAFLLAGSAATGSFTLAAAFAALTLLTTSGLGLWAAAGWSGCLHLSSGWNRRHLDWGFGLLMFVAAIASLAPAG